MADSQHIEVAKAYVTIVPSMEGSQKTIATEMGAAVEPAAKEAGEKSGKTLGSSLAKGLKTTAAVVGTAMAAFTAAAVGTGKAFVNAAKETADFGDSIQKNAAKMNMSVSGYQEWDYILKRNGSSIESMKTSMLKLTKAAESGDDAFKALGISEENLAKMSPEETFNATIKALQGVEDAGQRTVLANKLLGKGAVELAPLLNQSADATEALRQQVHDLGGVMSDEAVNNSADFKDSLTDMETALTGLKNNMMSQFLPSLSTVTTGLAGIFSGSDIEGGLANIEKGIGDLANKLASKAPDFLRVGGTIISSLATAVSENLPTLLKAAVPVAGDLVKTIIGIAPTLISAVFDLVNSVLDWLVNGDGLTTLITGVTTLVTTLATSLANNIGTIIPMVVSAIMQIFTALTNPETIVSLTQAAITLVQELTNGILSALPIILEQLPVIIDNICNALLEGLPLLLDAGIQLFMSIVDALPTIIEALVGALPQIIETIINTVINAIPLLIDAAIKLLMALIQAIPKIIVALVKELPKIIITIITTLLNNLPALIKGAIELFMGIIKAIPTIIVELAKQMPTIIKAIIEGLMAGISQIAKVGGDLIRGLWNGIKDMGKWIGEKIKGFGKGILDGLKSFFKIKSPSRLMSDVIGKNLALGIGLGFENELDNVADDMIGQMDGLTGNMSATVTANGNPGEVVGNNTTYNGGAITVNVYGAEGQSVTQLADAVADRLAAMTARKGAVYA